MSDIARFVMGGRALGLFAAGVLLVTNLLLEPRYAWMVLAVLVALGNAVAGYLILGRTPFRLLGLATMGGAVECLSFALLLLVVPPRRIVESPTAWTVALGSFGIYAGVWLWSRRSAPQEWERWRRKVERTGILGLLLMRHVSPSSAQDQDSSGSR